MCSNECERVNSRISNSSSIKKDMDRFFFLRQTFKEKACLMILKQMQFHFFLLLTRSRYAISKRQQHAHSINLIPNDIRCIHKSVDNSQKI